MTWTQTYDPIGNLWISAAIASLPILLFFASLIIFKLKGWIAALLTVTLSIVIAIAVYQMPIQMALSSFAQGFLTGLWPIAWIILAAIFLYKLSVNSGYFEILKHSVMAITPDHRIQVILIGFCFGAFLEGAIGFGAPVAITAALLMGLGLRPLYAAGLCMIANTAPVAFGAVGIPIIALGKLVGVDALLISQMAGRMLPLLALFVPFFIVFLMDGMRGVRETFPAVFIAAGSFALAEFLSSNYLGPELPDIISALVSLALTTLFLRSWKPVRVFRVDGSEFDKASSSNNYTQRDIVLAWAPFVVLVAFIIVWSLPPFKALFSKDGLLAFTSIPFEMPFIHNTIMQVAPIVAKETAIKSVYTWPIIASVGTAIFFSALVSIFLLKANSQIVKKSAVETIKEMKFPILTIGLVVGFAFVAKNSGQAATMGLSLAETGDMFAFFSPIIGWLGVFLTGSDTSANLLFGTLQQVTANKLGINEVIFLAANSVGGVVGKMISPQSIAVACAAVGLMGRESELFRWTVKYSIGFIIVIGIMTYVIVHYMPWIIPVIPGK